MSKDINFNINEDLNSKALSQVGFEQGTGASESGKVLDLEKFSELKKVKESDPEYFEFLVKKSDGELVSEDELAKINDELANGYDGVKRTIDEDYDAVQDLVNLKKLTIKGDIKELVEGKNNLEEVDDQVKGMSEEDIAKYKEAVQFVKDECGCFDLWATNTNPERFMEIVFNEDGSLKSKEEIQKINKQVSEAAHEQIKEDRQDNLKSNIVEASKKYKEIKEIIVAKHKEMAEARGEDVSEDEINKLIAKNMDSKDPLAEFSGKEEINPEEIDDEKAAKVIADLDNSNKAVDAEMQIDEYMDADEIFANSFLFNGKKLEESLKQMEDATEQLKAANEAKAKAGQAAPAAESKDGEKLQEFKQSNVKPSTGLYVDNSGAVNKSYDEAVKNHKDRGLNNDKVFNKKHDEQMKKIVEQRSSMNYTDENDPIDLLLGDEEGKGGVKNVKEFDKKLAQFGKGEKEGDIKEQAGMGDILKKEKFSPFNNQNSENIAEGFDIGSLGMDESVTAEFDSEGADKFQLKETASDIKGQKESDAAIMDEEIGVEEERMFKLENDIETNEGIKSGVENIFGTAKDAAKNLETLHKANEVEQANQKKIADLQNQQIIPEMTNYANDKHSEGNKLESAGQALISAGTAMMSNPATAAAGQSMVYAGTGMQLAGVALNKEGTRADNNVNDVQKKVEAEARQREQQIAVYNQEIAQKKSEADQVAMNIGTRLVEMVGQQSLDMTSALGFQAKRVNELKENKEEHLSKLDQDENAVQAKMAYQEKTEEKGDKEQGKDTAVVKGIESEDKKTKAADAGIFEIKENNEEQASAKDKLIGENTLVKEAGQKKTAETQGVAQDKPVNMQEAKFNQKADFSGAANEDEGSGKIEFKAYSKENRLSKEDVQKDDQEKEGAAYANKKPVQRLASRIKPEDNKNKKA
ncbi:MAG: hypothetical protein ABIH00_02670 [Armatimonadota bacterium]